MQDAGFYSIGVKCHWMHRAAKVSLDHDEKGTKTQERLLAR